MSSRKLLVWCFCLLISSPSLLVDGQGFMGGFGGGRGGHGGHKGGGDISLETLLAAGIVAAILQKSGGGGGGGARNAVEVRHVVSRHAYATPPMVAVAPRMPYGYSYHHAPYVPHPVAHPMAHHHPMAHPHHMIHHVSHHVPHDLPPHLSQHVSQDY